MRRAKIIATIGPASSDEDSIRALIDAGMDVARLNFSHGSHDDHRAVYARVREASERAGRAVAILQDLQGPKIRVRRFKEGSVHLVAGNRFRLVSDPIEGDERQASISWERLHKEASVGDVVLLDDGLLKLVVAEVGDGWVDTEVVIGGKLSDNKGVNLPNTPISAPSLTPKDREDLALGIELGVDCIALSFVRSSLDIHQLRAYLPDDRDPPAIIAKIEKPQAVRAMRDIVAAADGIMVARGDLGVEMAPERVPVIQKELIELASEMGKIAITATQMLDSMTVNPSPTRAEASDVANAIYDGTDAVMLSAETAAGKHPLEAVRMMARIIEEAERSPFFRTQSRAPGHSIRTDRDSIARAVTAAAAALDVRVIACFTMTGRTPQLIKAYRPDQNVFAFTPRERVYQRLAIYRGIVPVLTELRPDTEGLIALVEKELARVGAAKPGEHVVIVMGVPAGHDVPANLIKYHRMPL